MKRTFEIMAPAGNFECLMAAIQGGADSVYFGIENLNMRSHSANNFTREDLPKIVALCREHGVKTYLTLNITLYDEDLQQAYQTLDIAAAAGVSAVIASARLGWKSTFPPSCPFPMQKVCVSTPNGPMSSSWPAN